MDYVTLIFSEITDEKKDILIALLSDAGYEGFEEGQESIKAYIPTNRFDEQKADQIAKLTEASYSRADLPETNWNELWESNFEPVVVDNFCTIRADFHTIPATSKFEIIITPKMSFGTGHHATTYMMIQQMSSTDIVDKSVFDFGTGTGVLAILAEKMGAENVIAIDNDDWSITNAQENISKNNAYKIRLLKADDASVGSQFDIILANITKNIIVENFSPMFSCLNSNGRMILSGLLATDEPAIASLADSAGLVLVQKLERAQWISLAYAKVN